LNLICIIALDLVAKACFKKPGCSPSGFFYGVENYDFNSLGEYMSDRVDGWKSIAAHFRRDRTTVLRWAKERNLPVKKIPGGKKSTVYALRSELDAWAAANDDETLPIEQLPDDEIQKTNTFLLKWQYLVILILAVSAITIAAVFYMQTPTVSKKGASLPKDKDVASLYLTARDRWATRSSEQIELAIRDLKIVVTREPDFALGHSALADAYLLAREYGKLRDIEGFAAARASATKALSLDPQSGPGHRALGYIQYWHEHNPLASSESFKKALALMPDDQQTLLWYGNILSDNGAYEDALSLLDRARQLSPGAREIQTYYGWTMWTAGRDKEAEAILIEVSKNHPDFAAVHDCLSVLYLSRDDFEGYAKGVAKRATSRSNTLLQSYSDAVTLNVRQQNEKGLRDAIFDHARQIAAAPGGENHAWTAYTSSLAGNRSRLIFALDQGEKLRENWGVAGYLDRIKTKWSKDAEIVQRIEQLRAPRIL
jgi:Tfp pilus assembly protein PilF